MGSYRGFVLPGERKDNFRCQQRHVVLAYFIATTRYFQAHLDLNVSKESGQLLTFRVLAQETDDGDKKIRTKIT